MSTHDELEPPVIATGEVLPLDRPWHWLEAGWRDFMRTPTIGLLYGGALVGASWALVLVVAIFGEIHLLLPLSGGFFILAPILVAGLYDTSRRLQRGEPVSPMLALFGWRAAGQLTMIGVVLLILHLVWIRIAFLLYPLFLADQAPGFDNLLPAVLGATLGLAVGTVIGGVLALVAYAATAVSIPMLIDRDITAIEAVITSFQVVQRNPRVMLLWAAILVVATAVGIATLFVGLAIVAPVLAHATWHAYRDAVAFGAIAPPRTSAPPLAA